MSDQSSPTPQSASLLQRTAQVTGLLVVAGLGGLLANILGLRAPWFFGALLAAMAGAMMLPRRIRPQSVPPRGLVRAFVALLAVLFGSRLAAGLPPDLAAWVPSLAAVVVFVFAAQMLGYLFFSRIGGLDAATAWLSATPGGLMESAAQGESAGADQAQIALLHFLRVMILVIGLPLAFSLWFGATPQAPGRLIPSAASASLTEMAAVLLTVLISFVLARKLPVPGVGLILPFLAGAALTSAGVLGDARMPMALAAAQIMLGTSLGTRFATLRPAAVWHTARLALAHTALLICVALVFAGVLWVFGGPPVWLSLLILSPAGIAEMAVIGLSLGADPVFIIAHHALRMGVALLLLPLVFHRIVPASAPR